MPIDSAWTLGRVRRVGAPVIPIAGTSTKPTLAPAAPVEVNETGLSMLQLGASVLNSGVVMGMGAVISGKDADAPRGYIVEVPDDIATGHCDRWLTGEMQKRWPDANIPWWLGGLICYSNLYIEIRKTREKRTAPELSPVGAAQPLPSNVAPIGLARNIPEPHETKIDPT